MSAGVALVGGQTLAELAELAFLAPPVIPAEARSAGSARREAAAWVTKNGFPDRKHEDWRYFDLRPLLGLTLAPAGLGEPGVALADLAPLLPPGLGGARLVVVNGRFVAGLSHLDNLPEQARVTSVASAGSEDGGLAGPVWPVPGHGYRHAFEALNAALAVDACLIEVAEGASLEVPIEVVYMSFAHGDLPLSSPRTVVMAGAGSAATVVESYLSAGEGASLTNAHTEVVLGAGARVEHYKLQAEAPEASHLSTLEVRPGARSRFVSALLAVGSRLGRHEVHVALAEEGAAVDLAGLYLPAGDQCHDNPVLVEHIAPRCASRQLYKGIVDGTGHGIFNGHVVVHPGAAGTDADQVNKNLLLSDHAEVDTRPRLEIFTDDVSCTHGAAVGQLDTDALFYLRSRGIPEPDARTLLISGFAQQVLGRFAEGPIRERAEHLVAAHLAAAAPERARARLGGRR
ncbi:MAG: Fe-S cluster assembly protein SufD [Acidimicrobiales bacterium]